MASKQSILSFNDLARIVGLPKIPKLHSQAPPKTGIATLRSSAADKLQADEAVEYRPVTIRELTQLLNEVVDRVAAGAAHGAGGLPPKVELYRMCGINVVGGVGGGSAVCFDETYIPVEIEVESAIGALRPPLKFLIRADVASLPGALDLLVSLEDIRKLSLHGIKLDFMQKSHQKRDQLLSLREEKKQLVPKLQINEYKLRNYLTETPEEEAQTVTKVRELIDRIEQIDRLIDELIRHDIKAYEL
jgi:hypothetical protein